MPKCVSALAVFIVIVAVIVASPGLTQAADPPKLGPILKTTLVRNPAGFMETVTDSPTIKVTKGASYELSVRFEGDPSRMAELNQLRRILIFGRASQRDCSRRECWTQIAVVNSRYGAEQTIELTVPSGELLIACWYVSGNSKSRAGVRSDFASVQPVIPPAEATRLTFSSPMGLAHVAVRSAVLE